MKDDRDKGKGQAGALTKNSGRGSTRDARQDRLKLALRENLKRRKSQARGRSDPTSAPSNVDDVSPYDGSGKKPDD